jgi:Flp pilus assembly protein TadD
MWRRTVLLAVAAGLVGGSGAGRGKVGPTFVRDIAPIVYAKCAPCHHTGGVGPFSLLEYDDVVDHARDIRRVTSTRFMPPWKPARGVAEYANDRSLSAEQIALLARWVDGGEELGDSRELPPPPTFPQSWQLGEPDIVVAPEPYELHADGPDVYRNLVIPAPVLRRRFVAGWELRAGTKVLHHAILNIDRIGLARLKDAQDPGPGFGGLDPGNVQSPDGLYLVWTPGRVPQLSPDTAWRIDEHTDLVLQLHMQPSGKPETVQPKIGLFLTDQPPTRQPFVLRIGDPPIDIAPGDPHYVIESSYVLPTDVEVLSVFPHAHYVARGMRSWATLPDGTERGLLRIDDWDFAWQDQYTFARPMALPAGTTIRMEFIYDNSPANPRNPSHPPRRVRTGERSVDEMGNVTFQVVPTERGGMALLRVSRYRLMLAGDDTARNRYNLANALADLGQTDQAIEHYRRAIALDPALAPARFNLSNLLAARGDVDGAIDELERALKVKPDYMDAHVNLGNALQQKGRPNEALDHYRAAVHANGGSALAHASLGLALARSGDLDGSIEQFRASVAIDPNDWLVRYYLGNSLRDRGTTDDAVAEYRRAIELRPDAHEPRDALAALVPR